MTYRKYFIVVGLLRNAVDYMLVFRCVQPTLCIFADFLFVGICWETSFNSEKLFRFTLRQSEMVLINCFDFTNFHKQSGAPASLVGGHHITIVEPAVA
ncbi:hypothetical protein DLM46_32320 [Paraburkholderia lacunae]|uniref:Uncharacterized protein n=1 Tax=Paraburkholderia lacunae TaxID=2211104 RepID=A0A370MZG2_9BURK|nr:hypothetical protein DLM46_32320 [Paraburkholderia lacunae]